MKLITNALIGFTAGLAILGAIAFTTGCAHKKPSPSHYLVIPPECFQSMSCKGDIVIRDGHAYCGTWALKYSCVKVK